MTRPSLQALLAATTFAALSTGCQKPATPTWSATIQEGQAAAQEVLRTTPATSVVIALTDARGTLWVQGFGLADRATGQVPDGGTLYGIGSVSKMFAATAVLQLAERGLVDLDAPYARYVPRFATRSPESRDVTVRMLLDHTSGLPGADYRNIFTEAPFAGYADQVLATVAGQRLKAPPGAVATYCNDGFTLVEPLVKAVTGKSYVEYVRDEIFAPLGMARSRFATEGFPDGVLARAYQGGELKPVEFVDAYASGGVYGTAVEMARFVRMFLDGGKGDLGVPVLSPISVMRMAVDRTEGTLAPVDLAPTAFGLGWDTVRAPGLAALGVRAWAKGGDSADYHAQILVAPDEKLGVVVLQASSGADKQAIAERVLLRAIAERRGIAFPAPLPPRIPAATPAPAGLADRMAGTFASDSAVLQVRPQSDGSLQIGKLAVPGGAVERVRHRSDGWFSSDARPLVSYRLADAGGRDYLAVRQPDGFGHYHIEVPIAERVPPAAHPLSPAWSARLGRRWLLVNERPDSTLWRDGRPLGLTVSALPELPGWLVVEGPDAGARILDPSVSDVRAVSRLVIPGLDGRDMHDLEIVAEGDEEWARWGSWLLRPVASIPALPRGTSRVAIGPAGYAEWRAVGSAAAPVRVHVEGARWKLIDGYLAVMGPPGSVATVTVE